MSCLLLFTWESELLFPKTGIDSLDKTKFIRPMQLGRLICAKTSFLELQFESNSESTRVDDGRDCRHNQSHHQVAASPVLAATRKQIMHQE
jgi:hypothetical protein